MNTRMLLETAVCRDPSDRFAVRVLADYLYENVEPTFFAACRLAGGVRRAMKSAAEVSEAAHYAAHANAWCNDMATAIRERLHLYPSAVLNLTITAGSRPPRITSDDRLPGGRWVVGYNITVGARWVIACVWNVRVMWVNRPDAVPGYSADQSAEVVRALAWKKTEERYAPTNKEST